MDQSAMYAEVEDIMCDQRIISKELSAAGWQSKTSYIILSAARLQVVVAIFARSVMPVALRIYYVYLKNQQLVVHNVKHHFFPALAAFVANSISHSLATVQRKIARRAVRRLSAPAITSEEDTSSSCGVEELSPEVPEKSVECQVLFSPEEERDADVIFIHGLHGGVDKTWKQGLWRHGGHKLLHQTPVRSQSTGDMYVPPRKPSLKRTFSHMYSKSPSKIARKENEFCFPNGEQWEVIESDDAEDETYAYSPCWPQDWIPKDCPGVRVIALNYTTDVLWCPVWKKKRNRTDMVERSDEMLEELLRLDVGRKPIIWVGHSKGGLFIKQIILNAWERHRRRPDICRIFNNSKGVMFYSVPHRGSYLADCKIPLLRRSVEVIEIQRNCEFMLDLHRRFLEICEKGTFKAEIFSFIETSFTFMSFMYLKIVAYESADPGIGVKCDVPLDHREICKPAGRDCFLYTELIKIIKKSYENATS